MKNLLGSLSMNVEPDPLRMQATRERMMQVACSSRHTNSARRTVLTVGLLLVGVSAVGMAATQAGRDFVRWIFTSIETEYSFTHEVTSGTPGAKETWGASRKDRPFTAKEITDIKAKHAEIDQIKKEGGGRLVGLIEGPDPLGSSHPSGFLVEYTLSDGSIQTVGQGCPAGKQRTNLRVDEILALRDAGAGAIISERPGPLGLGDYTIRFTLSDGQTVDLTANYPPGTRQDRDKIFAETRALKNQLRFAVDDPRGPQSDGGVWGTLRYTLADGRTVGIIEQVPKEALTPDGKHVAVPENEATKNDSRQTKDGMHRTKTGWSNLTAEQEEEVEPIMEAGGGRLSAVFEVPNPLGSSSQYTVTQVEFTLADGKTLQLNGPLTEKQKVNMRWDEISALRDAGAGQVVSQEPSHRGLGKYTVRFTLSDGQLVDVTTNYPPGTRQDREKIFAETRALKKQLRFAVEDPRGPEMDGDVWGLLRYTLADGRTVGIMERVPKEALTPDGKHVAVPASQTP